MLFKRNPAKEPDPGPAVFYDQDADPNQGGTEYSGEHPDEDEVPEQDPPLEDDEAS